MKVLITGATGFIGSHLAERLLREGFDVYALLRHSPRQAEISLKLKSITGDLLDIHSLRKAVREVQPEVVIHTAAITPVRYSFENPFIYAQTNYVGTMNLVHASLESNVLKKFIHASTAEVYKSKPGLLREEDELFGSTPYGVSKVAAELYVKAAGECFGLPYIILRPSNTYGRKTERGYFIEKVVTTIMKENKLVLDGSPNRIRDFMYIDDHVEAYMKTIEKGRIGEVYNISTSRGLTLGEVVEIARSIFNWDGEVVFGRNPRPYDPPSLVLDNRKAREELGWKSRYTLEKGLRLIEEYWRDRI